MDAGGEHPVRFLILEPIDRLAHRRPGRDDIVDHYDVTPGHSGVRRLDRHLAGLIVTNLLKVVGPSTAVRIPCYVRKVRCILIGGEKQRFVQSGR